MNQKISQQKLGLFFLVFLLSVLFMPCQIYSFTLDEIMSYAYPLNPVVSPKGDLVAWISEWKEEQNIWIAQGPGYMPRQLTHYFLDDGQKLSALAFSADGKIIVYVKGGSANRAGEYPNPTSNPEGTEQAVWAIKIEGGKPWRLGQGNKPLPSPVGNKVAYSLRGEIYLVTLDGVSKPKLLFKARGKNGSQTWAPDASKLAFVSEREDHSFIGVYDFKDKSISWISPSVDRDSYPVWSPCAKYIAFIRFLRSPGIASLFSRRGERFSLIVADIESGKAKEIWRCPNKTAGFAQYYPSLYYYPSETLRWAANGHLVFYSEHEKWLHLYSISVNNKKLIHLTPGKYEVENSFLSVDGKTLIFNSNSGDIDRRHIWAVPVTGGKAKLLTPGKGIEWAPVLTTKSKDLVFLCSTFRQPAAPAVMNLEGKDRRLIAPEAIPNEFPMKELVEPQQVVLKAPDGLEIHAQLFLPKGAKPGDKRPSAIFIHGGPPRQMLLGWHMQRYYHSSYAMNQYLTHKGYVVLSVNFRGGIGYGYNFRNAANRGAKGASEYQDIVAAGRYLQKRPEVDLNKIGLWGGSYGGYLTALGLARNSELFAAGVDLHGVSDRALRARRLTSPEWIIHEEDLELAYQSSPVAHADFWTSPVLFIHGDNDQSVDFIQTTNLVLHLRKSGKAHVELLIFPDEGHGFLLHKNWLKVYKSAADFFDRFLK
jgi:dipeptidyl-peptidase-4